VVGGVVLNRAEEIAQRTVPMTAFDAVHVASLTTFNPDAAVARDGKRDAQPFRSKVDGLLPLSRHRATVLPRNVKARNNEVRKRKMTLQLDAFATPGFHLACRLLSYMRNPASSCCGYPYSI
jgi:hypothetical protein